MTEPDKTSLPRPLDDGAADHLAGQVPPAVDLRTSDGSTVNLADDLGTVIVCAYPRIGHPDDPLPENWGTIPGAGGCADQASAYRNLRVEFQLAGVDHIFGLSTQDSLHQSEWARRLDLPHLLISDSELRLTLPLGLPRMQVNGRVVLKRLTMILRRGKIIHTIYPVFPPHEDAANVLDWIKRNPDQ